MRRLILFDIDETMIKSDGAGRRALTRALTLVFGQAVDSDGVFMSGKTDPQICREILQRSGIDGKAWEAGRKEVLGIYPPILEEEIDRASEYRLLAGVTELIEALSARRAAHLGLLTGNIEQAARLKLKPFALNRFFPVGAFGSDAEDRLALPEIAHARAQRHYGHRFAAREVVIVGDSVADVYCAHHFGAVSIAVNTGRTTHAELVQSSPRHLLPSLAETQRVIEAIFA